MRKLFIFVPLFLTSCYEIKNFRTIELNEKPNIVIDKKSFYYPPFRLHIKAHIEYKINVYNGETTEWFQVSKDDFNKISKNDTLKNFNIKQI
jgi:hypothetical protein